MGLVDSVLVVSVCLLVEVGGGGGGGYLFSSTSVVF